MSLKAPDKTPSIVRKGMSVTLEKKNLSKMFSQTTVDLKRKRSRQKVYSSDLTNPLKKMTQFLSTDVDLKAIIEESVACIGKNLKCTYRTYWVDAERDQIHCIINNEEHWFPINNKSIIAANVAYNKEYVLLSDLSNNDKHDRRMKFIDGSIRSILSVPIVLPDNTCYSVIEFYRYQDGENFTINDVKLVVVICGWKGAAIHQNNIRLVLRKQRDLNNSLIDVTKKFFANQISLETLLYDILSYTKKHLRAEKGTFYILHKMNNDLYATIYEEALFGKCLCKKNLKLAITDEANFIYQVCKKGAVINMQHDEEIEKCDDFMRPLGVHIKALLLVPIMGLDVILGALQLINKTDKTCFTSDDEVASKTFTVYYALALHFWKKTIKMERKMHANAASLDLLERHFKPCQHDIDEFDRKTFLPEYPEMLSEFQWYIEEDKHQLMPQYVLHMIVDICGEISVDIEVLKSFVLTMRKSYRKRPYHNFEHAFTFTHCTYCILKRNKSVFSEIEAKSMIIAAIAHDVDHRGFTNNFCTLTNNVIAQLYDESQMENHHIFVTMMILSRHNIFPTMPEAVYKHFCNEIKETILASNLAFHFKYRAKIIQLYMDDTFDWHKTEHRFLLKAMMVTISDLSGCCKPFWIAKKVTQGLYDEFYYQGDKEKQMGVTPLSMMDRTKKHMIPEDQCQFLTVVILPCADILRKMLPNTEPLFAYSFEVRECWRKIIENNEPTGLNIV